MASSRCAALVRIAATKTSGWHRLSRRKRGDMSQNENNTDWAHLLQAQKETERQLREQKLQLDTALNNMLQGLCMFDAEEKIVLFNQRYVDIINLPAGDLLGLSLNDLMRQAQQIAGHPQSLADEVRASMRAGRPDINILE